MADMKSVAPRLPAFALTVAGGLVVALVGFAWASHGEAIYLAMLSGGYLTCF